MVVRWAPRSLKIHEFEAFILKSDADVTCKDLFYLLRPLPHNSLGLCQAHLPHLRLRHRAVVVAASVRRAETILAFGTLSTHNPPLDHKKAIFLLPSSRQPEPRRLARTQIPSRWLHPHVVASSTSKTTNPTLLASRCSRRQDISNIATC